MREERHTNSCWGGGTQRPTSLGEEEEASTLVSRERSRVLYRLERPPPEQREVFYLWGDVFEGLCTEVARRRPVVVKEREVSPRGRRPRYDEVRKSWGTPVKPSLVAGFFHHEGFAPHHYRGCVKASPGRPFQTPGCKSSSNYSIKGRLQPRGW